MSCLLISLIRCLKGHKSLGSLFSVVKTLIVSGAQASKQGTRCPIELLWTAKKNQRTYCHEPKSLPPPENQRHIPSTSGTQRTYTAGRDMRWRAEVCGVHTRDTYHPPPTNPPESGQYLASVGTWDGGFPQCIKLSRAPEH